MLNCSRVFKWKSSTPLFFMLVCCEIGHSQVNAYAKVSALGGANLSVNNINQTYGSFVPGEQVLIIQMQGAGITHNNNWSSFGTISSLNSAGLYEIATIASVNIGAGLIALTGNPVNSYNTGGNVQVLSYPVMGTGGYTTTADIAAVPWNGSIGGVVAFIVNGNLNLNHNISGDAAGFRGGAKAGNNGDACDNNMYRTSSGDGRYADKGEGIYVTTSSQRAGKAKAANGGGGGLVHNGGGGGGGNYTQGGNGFYGFDGEGCSNSNSAGGQGGLALASSATRVFLGGGGGGAQENNSNGTSGGRGGGIVFISADSVIVNGTLTQPRISANAQNGPASTGHDGAGGGGGGGSVVLAINGVRATPGHTLLVQANGGNGGNVNHFDLHGSGGGGGQGTIQVSNSGPLPGTFLQTLNGQGGLASTNSSAPRAGSGGGTDNDGVRWGVASALPVELIMFVARESEPGTVELIWKTASEHNSSWFEVQHMAGTGQWNTLGKVKSAGDSRKVQEYSFYHHGVRADLLNYYRLKQIDTDGSINFSDIIYLELQNHKLPVNIYPSPARNYCILECNFDISGDRLELINQTGMLVPFGLSRIDAHRHYIDLSDVAPGLYVLRSARFSEKLIVE